MLTEDVSRFVDAALSLAIYSGGKRPSKYTAIPRARHRLAAVFLICRACSHRTGWAGRRSRGAPSDSQQVLPTNVSVSGRLPRLMGTENFRVGY